MTEVAQGLKIHAAQFPGDKPESGEFLILGVPDDSPDEKFKIGETEWADEEHTALMFNGDDMEIWMGADMLRDVAKLIDELEAKLKTGTLEMH